MNSPSDIFFWLVIPIGSAFLVYILGAHLVGWWFGRYSRPFPPVIQPAPAEDQLYDQEVAEEFWALVGGIDT